MRTVAGYGCGRSSEQPSCSGRLSLRAKGGVVVVVVVVAAGIVVVVLLLLLLLLLLLFVLLLGALPVAREGSYGRRFSLR